MATPGADPLKFTTIAHAGHRYYGPLSAWRARALAQALAPAAGGTVLDIGCGRAQLLLDVLAAHPVAGLGVDANREFVARARAAAAAAGLAARARLVAGRLRDTVRADGTYAAVICTGSSQAVGTPAEALTWMHDALAPGGVALWADGFWKQAPAREYLGVLDAREDELGSHADNAALARAAGFLVLATAASNDDEWDEYEGLYCGAVERYVAAHPQDLDAPAMAERIRRWHDAYLRWGRATLGYGYYTLQKPASAASP